MHVSIGAVLIISIIIILLIVAAGAAGALTIQEAEVCEAGGGDELRQLPGLDPGGGAAKSLLIWDQFELINGQGVHLKREQCWESWANVTSLLHSSRPGASLA